MNQSHSPSQSKHAHLAIGILAILLVTNPLHAQCPPPPPPPFPNGVIEGPVSCLGDQSANGTVGIDHLDRFIVSFERPFANASQVWALRFAADGMPIDTTAPISDTAINTDSHHTPSLAMSPFSRIRVGWLAHRAGGLGQGLPDTLLISDFDFVNTFPPIPTPAPGSRGDEQPSVGISDVVGIAGQAFSNAVADPPRKGLVYQVGTSPVTQLRTCGPLGVGDVCFTFDTLTTTAWQPVLCQRSDGGHTGPVLHDSRNRMTGWPLL